MKYLSSNIVTRNYFEIDYSLFIWIFRPTDMTSLSPSFFSQYFFLNLYNQEEIRAKFRKLMSSLSGITEQKVVFDEEKLSVTKKRHEKKLSNNRKDQLSGANITSEGKQKSPLLSAEFYRSEVLL